MPAPERAKGREKVTGTGQTITLALHPHMVPNMWIKMGTGYVTISKKQNNLFQIYFLPFYG
jgi:hypothetical protein